jgi:hypothetical protein
MGANLSDLKLEVKTAIAQHDVGTKSVESLKLHQAVDSSEFAKSAMPINADCTRCSMELNDSRKFGLNACTLKNVEQIRGR